jgi:hypothetical protein
MSQLQRYRSGGWGAMSDAGSWVYYGGAWHNPCSGPKTLYHYEGGSWQEFPCPPAAIPDIQIGAFPSVNSFNQAVAGLKSDGSAVTLAGDKLRYFTVSVDTNQNIRDFSYFFPSWDYSTMYGYRTNGGASPTTISDTRFLQMEGGNAAGVYIEFDLTRGGTISGPLAPLWFEFEIASDDNYPGLMYGASGPILTAPIVEVHYSDGTINKLCLQSTYLGGNPDHWYDQLLNFSFPSGLGGIWSNHTHDLWNDIVWKIPASGQAGELVYNGGHHASPVIGTVGARVNKIRIGIVYDNTYYGGRVNFGAMTLGTAYAAYDILSYACHWDGLPWQTLTGGGFAEYPNKTQSPDQTTHKNYDINVVAGSFPSGVMYESGPDFMSLAQNSGITSGGQTVERVDILDTTGLSDSTLSDFHFMPPFGNSAQIVLNRYAYAITATVGAQTWTHMRMQYTAAGLKCVREHLEDPDTATPFASAVTLHLINPSTGALVNGLRFATDYPNYGSSGNLRYAYFYAGFTPSGNKVWWFRIGSSSPAIPFNMELATINLDGTGYAMAVIGHNSNGSDWMAFDPLNEAHFFYSGTDGVAAGGVVKGFTDGVTSTIMLYDIAGSADGLIKFCPDTSYKSVMGFFESGNFYCVSSDGLEHITPITNINSQVSTIVGFGTTVSGPHWSWAPNATVTSGLTLHGKMVFTHSESAADYIFLYDFDTGVVSTLFNSSVHTPVARFFGQISWFHGWQGENQYQ